MHIAIAGNIGSGKTTLTGLLAKHYKWKPQYEDVDDNPYLNDFTRICNVGASTCKFIFE
jgi:deoxyadenosine/deoxycytidine kinase